MRRRWVGAAAVFMLACGGGGSLPDAQDGEGGPPQTPAGRNDEPVPPSTGTEVKASQSLWPLTVDSSWRYRITEEGQPGPTTKTVRVLRAEKAPGTDVMAVVVESEQPHLTERSWQVERDGLTYRLREEDYRGGQFVRRTTWAPATVKSLADATAAGLGWTHEAKVTETTFYAADNVEEQQDRTYVWKVLGVNETVTVPAGTFTHALKVQRHRINELGEPKKERTYWLVPGVGKVREEGERTEELEEYEVKAE